eukprot:gene14245-20218_t
MEKVTSGLEHLAGISDTLEIAGVLDAVFYGAAMLMKKVNMGKNT